MKNRIFLYIILFSAKSSFAQLSTAACVHGTGIEFLLNAYDASMGACNCQRSGVILTSMKNCETDPFILDFEDNFDGDSVDISKWNMTPNQGALEGDQNTGLYTWNNIQVNDGFCHLVAKKETVTARAVSYWPDNQILKDNLPNLRTFTRTSGSLQTIRQFLYGMYEIRCRMPEGNGFWPAFWTFGGKRWNEIDIFDSYAGTKEFVTSIGHDFEGANKPNGCNFSRKGFDLSEWHTYTCIFDYDKMTILIDGETVREVFRVITVDRKPVLCGDDIGFGTYFQLEAYPIEPMNIIFNLALISEHGPGSSIPIDGTTPFPSSFDVDYVRYWKRSPGIVDIYPNPTSGPVKIHSNSAIKSLEISNIAGIKIYQNKELATDLETDISGFPDGIYIVRAELEGTYKTSKIVKIGVR